MKSFTDLISEHIEHDPEMNFIDELSEASVVNLDAVSDSIQKAIKKIEKSIYNAKVVEVFDGIHGIIAIFKRENRQSRLDKKEMVAIMKHTGKSFRWIDMEYGNISVGLTHK